MTARLGRRDVRPGRRSDDPLGPAVLDRLTSGGDERVLDAGCGTGRVTELLAERLPNGHVVALDGSAAMVERRPGPAGAVRRSGRATSSPTWAPRIPLAGPVDAILSTATFHWVPDHDALFANLAAVLRHGGFLVAQCGGVGNIANVQAASRRSATAGPDRSTSRR